MTKAYTEEEVQQLLKDHEDKLEARHFEEKTEEVLAQINRRLNEANGYKSTIGKNVIEIRDEVKDIKSRVIDLEEARKQAADQVKQSLLEREKHEDAKREWYQDWWVRFFGLATVLWEIINIYQASTGASIHHAITGK